MHRRATAIALALAALTLPLTSALTADDAEIERDIALEDVPDAAQKVIIHEANGNEILDVDEIIVGDARIYEAEWSADGGSVEIRVAADGEILGWERENATGDDAD